jgi:O-antigen ligase
MGNAGPPMPPERPGPAASGSAVSGEPRPSPGIDRALFLFVLLFAALTSQIAAANIALGIVLLLWFITLRRDRRWREAFSIAPVLPIGLFVFFVIVSAVCSPHLARSLRGLPGYVTFLVVPLVADAVISSEKVQRVVDVLGAAGIVLALIGYGQFAAGARSLADRIRGPESHYMTYSGILLVIALLHLGRALEGRGRRRVFSAAVVAILAGALLLTFTRNVYVGFAVAILAYLALWRPRGLILVPILAAGVYLASPAGIRQRILSIGDPDNPTNRDRIDMAIAGGRMIRDHPLAGVGLTLVKPLYPLYRVPDSPRFRVPHLHDNVVQIAAESGLPAAAAYVFLVVVVLWRTARGVQMERDPLRRSLYAGAFLAVVGITAAGFFEYNFGDTEVLMTTLLAMALPFCRALRLPAQPGEAGERRP